MPIFVAVDNTNRIPAFENKFKTAIQPWTETDEHELKQAENCLKSGGGDRDQNPEAE